MSKSTKKNSTSNLFQIKLKKIRPGPGKIRPGPGKVGPGPGKVGPGPGKVRPF